MSNHSIDKSSTQNILIHDFFKKICKEIILELEDLNCLINNLNNIIISSINEENNIKKHYTYENIYGELEKLEVDIWNKTDSKRKKIKSYYSKGTNFKNHYFYGYLINKSKFLPISKYFIFTGYLSTRYMTLKDILNMIIYLYFEYNFYINSNFTIEELDIKKILFNKLHVKKQLIAKKFEIYKSSMTTYYKKEKNMFNDILKEKYELNNNLSKEMEYIYSFMNIHKNMYFELNKVQNLINKLKFLKL